ncbi:MAG: flagellar hook-length control protein FliK [bacterium]
MHAAAPAAPISAIVPGLIEPEHSFVPAGVSVEQAGGSPSANAAAPVAVLGPEAGRSLTAPAGAVLTQEGVLVQPVAGPDLQDGQAGQDAGPRPGIAPQAAAAPSEAEVPSGPLFPQNVQIGGPADGAPVTPTEVEAPLMAPVIPEEETVSLRPVGEGSDAARSAPKAPSADKAVAAAAADTSGEAKAAAPVNPEAEIVQPDAPAAGLKPQEGGDEETESGFSRQAVRSAGAAVREDQGATAPAARTGLAVSADEARPAEGAAQTGSRTGALAVDAADRAPAEGAAPKPAASHAGESHQMDSLLRVQVHRQVLEAASARLALAVRDKVAHARIQLNPPSLGRVNMELRVDAGHLTARIQVEHAWVKEAVESGLRNLRESLEEQGVTVEQFTVDVESGFGSESFEGDPAKDAAEAGSFANALSGDEDDGTVALEAVAAADFGGPAGRGTLNIFA